MQTVANAQRKGYKCAYLDVEQSFNPEYSTSLGVNNKELVFAQPDTAEDTLNLYTELVRTGDIKLVVLDSIAALKSKAELEGKTGEAFVGVVARMMGQHCRKISSFAKNNNTLCIYINQTRENIGVVYGSKTVTPGGKAIKFFSSMRIVVKTSTKLVDSKGNRIGSKIILEVIKNKLSAPYKKVETILRYGQGYDNYHDIIELSINRKIVEASGAWIQYGDNKWQGKEKFKAELINNNKLFEEIKGKVIGD